MEKPRDTQKQVKQRSVPMIDSLGKRTFFGFSALVLCVIYARVSLGMGSFFPLLFINSIAWLLSIWVTHKYVHKYAQQYLSYVAASHLKSSFIMLIMLGLLSWFVGPAVAPLDVVWKCFIYFVLADLLISIPHHSRDTEINVDELVSMLKEEVPAQSSSGDDQPLVPDKILIDKSTLSEELKPQLEKNFADYIEQNVPHSTTGQKEVLILDDLSDNEDQSNPERVQLLVGRTSINNVLRLNKFLKYCANRVEMGGYLAVRYVPIEVTAKNLKDKYKGLSYKIAATFHFLYFRVFPKIPWVDVLYFSSPLSWLDVLSRRATRGRNRVISKAEMWGRLSFYGMDVMAESDPGNNETYLVAQRSGMPVEGKKPSFYLVVGLEKIGLDGVPMRTHKVRTMYPFSEHIQKRLYQDHGLSSTGKFKNDFRLTEFGKFVRKYWIDELPQIFDWLRGDVKLVGLRATSRHFLSLYSKDFLKLYVQIKPGLIPPIFDASTSGFDDIVKIEMDYLESYWDKPYKTDIQYLFRTFRDIVFRGIRSK